MALFEGRNLPCLRGERIVFRMLDFALGPGDALLLVGANGSGKSSLLRLMTGLLGPSAVVGPWPVTAGHRGGSANCTVAWLGQTSAAVCGWATGHTIGALVSPVRDTGVGELAALLTQMRYDLQRD